MPQDDRHVRPQVGRRRHAIAMGLPALFIASACGEAAPARPTPMSPPPRSMPDAGVPEAPPDAGPPPSLAPRARATSCLDCDTGCRAGACITVDGESIRYCADACDPDLAPCVDGFHCTQIGEASFCVPPSGVCDLAAGLGATCYADSPTCLPSAEVCEGDVFHGLGYCTRPCESDGDCPDAFRCDPGDDGHPVCRAKHLAPAFRCGRSAERGCLFDADCVASEMCVRTSTRHPGVCARPCGADEVCGPGHACRPTPRGPSCLAAACDCHGAPADDDLIGAVLAQVGRSRCDVLVGPAEWTAVPAELLEDPFRLPLMMPTLSEPLRAPSEGAAIAEAAVQGTNEGNLARIARLIRDQANRLGRPAAITPVRDEATATDLATSLSALLDATGGSIDSADLMAQASAVPAELRAPLARLVEGIEAAWRVRNDAIPEGSREILFQYGPAFLASRQDGLRLDLGRSDVYELLESGIDYPSLFGGGADLVERVGSEDWAALGVAGTSTTPAPAHYLLSVDTPIGRIAVADAAASIHSAQPEGGWALLVDLGGDDIYQNAAGANDAAENAVSVLLDLGGDDQHGYVAIADPADGGRRPSDGAGRYDGDGAGPFSLSDQGRQGAGRLGFALVADLGGGNDRYESLRLSQGAGILGVGVLFDDGGNDDYVMEAVGQGAGAFGIGVLSDRSGDDRYEAYQFAQGLGYVRGAGLLVDDDGNDRYELDVGDPDFGGDPIYFSVQRPGQANASIGQGFGFGIRNDAARLYLSGGLGVLIDGAGDDRYRGSTFVQGGGFWFGAGFLIDRAGNDAYDGIWYAMGTGAHFALGALLDRAGDDQYGGELPRINVTLGAGHDYSVGCLFDAAGADVYRAARISLGAGNANGTGLFFEAGGDDAYHLRHPYAAGHAGLRENRNFGNARRRVPSWGIFVDGAGRDEYQAEFDPPPAPRDTAIWRQWQTDLADVLPEVELGLGADAEGRIYLPFEAP